MKMFQKYGLCMVMQLSFKSLVLHLLLFLTNFHTSPRPEHSERLCWNNASKRFQKGRCLVDS